MNKHNFTAHARKVFNTEIDALRKVSRNLGKNFDRAITIILKSIAAGGKIVVTGVGKNLHIAEKISSTLRSTGTISVTLNPTQAMHGDLGMLCNNDILIALSYSGESEELTALLPLVKRRRIKIIAVTGKIKSTLTSFCDCALNAEVDREACPFNMAPTSSSTAALVMGDAIAMSLLAAKGFRREDYAGLHPGGAIGRTLLLRVSDIMRTGKRLVSVKPGTKVKAAMLAMTKARSGSVGIIGPARELLGIFTDGDLRRHLFSDKNLLEKPISEVMSRSPVTAQPDMLVAEAMNIFEEHNIDDLLVVDNRGKLVGAVDIQDLPKLKIF